MWLRRHRMFISKRLTYSSILLTVLLGPAHAALEQYFPADSLFFLKINNVEETRRTWNKIRDKHIFDSTTAEEFEKVVLETVLPIPKTLQPHYRGEIAIGISDTGAFLDRYLSTNNTDGLPVINDVFKHMVFMAELKDQQAALHEAQIKRVEDLLAQHQSANRVATLNETHIQKIPVYIFSIQTNNTERIQEAWCYVEGLEIACKDLEQLASAIHRVKTNPKGAAGLSLTSTGEDVTIRLLLAELGKGLQKRWQENDTLLALTGISFADTAKALDIRSLPSFTITYDLSAYVNESLSRNTFHSGRLRRITSYHFKKDSRLSELLLPDPPDQAINLTAFFPTNATRYAVSHLPFAKQWNVLNDLLKEMGPQAVALKTSLQRSLEKETGLPLNQQLFKTLDTQYLSWQLPANQEGDTPQNFVATTIKHWPDVQKLMQNSRLNGGGAPRMTKHSLSKTPYYTFRQADKTLAYAYLDPYLVVSMSGIKSMETLLKWHSQHPTWSIPSGGSKPVLHAGNMFSLVGIHVDHHPDITDVLMLTLNESFEDPQHSANIFSSRHSKVYVGNRRGLHLTDFYIGPGFRPLPVE